VSKRKQRDSAASPAIYLVAAIVAAIAGFGTVYVSFAPSDNGEAELSGPGSSGEGTASGPLAGLNKGPMAPLLLRPKPLDLPEIAFAEGDGKPRSLADFSGKVVLLNIWATWCVPCREEMPALDKLETKLGGKDFEVVAINIDKGGADKAAANVDYVRSIVSSETKPLTTGAVSKSDDKPAANDDGASTWTTKVAATKAPR